MDVTSFILAYTEGKKKGGGGGGFDADTFFSVGLEEVNLEKATTLRVYAIYNVATLKRLTFPKLETLNMFSISNCSGLTSLTFPKSFRTSGTLAVSSCIALAEVTFEGKPTGSIASMFNACNNLKTINVPWAEGEVAGAPWGAPSTCTINYNYKEG